MFSRKEKLVCATCKKKPMFSCSGCNRTKYCSQKCQKIDWCRDNGHSILCESFPSKIHQNKRKRTANKKQDIVSWCQEQYAKLGPKRCMSRGIPLFEKVSSRKKYISEELTDEKRNMRDRIYEATNTGMDMVVSSKTGKGKKEFTFHWTGYENYQVLLEEELAEVTNEKLFPSRFLPGIEKNQYVSFIVSKDEKKTFVGGIIWEFKNPGDEKDTSPKRFERVDVGNTQFDFHFHRDSGRAWLKEYIPGRNTFDLGLTPTNPWILQQSVYTQEQFLVFDPINDKIDVSGEDSRINLYRPGYFLSTPSKLMIGEKQKKNIRDFPFLIELKFFEVNANFRGRGIGKAFLAHWTNVIMERVFPESYVFLFSFRNRQTINFYEKVQKNFIPFEKYMNSAMEKDYVLKMEVMRLVDESIRNEIVRDKNRFQIDEFSIGEDMISSFLGKELYYIYSNRFKEFKGQPTNPVFNITEESREDLSGTKREQELIEKKERRKNNFMEIKDNVVRNHTRNRDRNIRSKIREIISDDSLSFTVKINILTDEIIDGGIFLSDLSIVKETTSSDSIPIAVIELLLQKVPEKMLDEIIDRYRHLILYIEQTDQFENKMGTYDKGFIQQGFTFKNSNLQWSAQTGMKLDRVMLLAHLESIEIDMNDTDLFTNVLLTIDRKRYIKGKKITITDLLSSITFLENLEPEIINFSKENRFGESTDRIFEELRIITPFDTEILENERILGVMKSIFEMSRDLNIDTILEISLLDNVTLKILQSFLQKENLLAEVDRIIIDVQDVEIPSNLLSDIQKKFPEQEIIIMKDAFKFL